MVNTKLNPCPLCGMKPVVEVWSSGGLMFMVKCNNPMCSVPINGYPTGRNLEEVKCKWNKGAW